MVFVKVLAVLVGVLLARGVLDEVGSAVGVDVVVAGRVTVLVAVATGVCVLVGVDDTDSRGGHCRSKGRCWRNRTCIYRNKPVLRIIRERICLSINVAQGLVAVGIVTIRIIICICHSVNM